MVTERSAYLAGTLRMAMGLDSGGRFDAPAGWYLASDVAQLVGVDPRRIGQWAAHEYIVASRAEGPPQVFGYNDVAEALLVRYLLLERGVPQREIRTTVENCRREFGNWPLTNAPLALIQKGKVAQVVLNRPDGAYDIGKSTGNQKLVPGIDELRVIAQLLRRGGWVILYHPNIEHIEVDPGTMSGQPVIRGRRLPAAQVAIMAGEPGGRRELRDDYRLKAVEINDAVEWWRAVALETRKAA